MNSNSLMANSNNNIKINSNSINNNDGKARGLNYLTMPNLTVQSAARMMWLRDSEHATNDNNGPMSVEELLTSVMDPSFRKQRRVAGMKRRAEPTVASDITDNRYRTMHPKKLNVRKLLDRSEIHFHKKSKRIQLELSKQEKMIQSQGGIDVTKKYQLVHSDLGKLLRSISESNSSSSPENDRPRRHVMAA